jgi:hypothetical protein
MLSYLMLFLENPGLLASSLSCYVSHIYLNAYTTLNHVGFKVNLGSTYAKYNHFCIKGKIVTLVNITHADYVKTITM